MLEVRNIDTVMLSRVVAFWKSPKKLVVACQQAAGLLDLTCHEMLFKVGKSRSHTMNGIDLGNPLNIAEGQQQRGGGTGSVPGTQTHAS